MEFIIVNEKLIDAINRVVNQDAYLLIHNLHEPAISHRFAVYLEPHFPDFNVDCEYDGNIDADKDKKYVTLLRERALAIGIKLKDDEADNETIDRSIYPDIIVHRRGGNGPDNNLLVVEVKLSSSRVRSEWDETKLSLLTSNDNNNNFNYQFGVFVRFYVRERINVQDICWYQNGERIA